MRGEEDVRRRGHHPLRFPGGGFARGLPSRTYLVCFHRANRFFGGSSPAIIVIILDGGTRSARWFPWPERGSPTFFPFSLK